MTTSALLDAIGGIEPSVLYVIDTVRQRFTFAADRVVEMLGYPRSAIQGASFASNSRQIGFLRSRLCTEHRGLVAEHLDSVCASQNDAVSTIILKLQHANGNWRWFEARSRVLTRDRAGHVTRIVGLLSVLNARANNRREAALQLHLENAERSRIARELHDGTAQDLVAMDLSLARAERVLRNAETGSSELLTVINDIRGLTNHIKQELRVSVLSLRLPELKDRGIATALADMAANFGERTGLSVAFDTSGPQAPLSPAVEHALWRLSQEGLVNVYRHARARSAHLSLNFKEETVEFEIADDGEGLDYPAEPARIGCGLKNMGERVAELGGAFSIVPRRGGFVIRASMGREAGPA